MLATFSTRLVIAVFGGFLAGLLVGVIGKYAFDADWNVFFVAAAGIMVGSIALGAGHAVITEQIPAEGRKDAEGA
jgi:hypothetical protein